MNHDMQDNMILPDCHSSARSNMKAAHASAPCIYKRGLACGQLEIALVEKKLMLFICNMHFNF